MSWSRTANGTGAEVHEVMKAWQASVEQSDGSSNASADVVRLHGEQVQRCVKQVTSFIEGAKEGHTFSISAGGHAGVSTTGEVQADSVWLTCGSQLPAKAA